MEILHHEMQKCNKRRGKVRRLHVNSTRVEDTTNQILSEVGNGNYIQVKMPEIKAAPPIDPLLIPVAVG